MSMSSLQHLHHYKKSPPLHFFRQSLFTECPQPAGQRPGRDPDHRTGNDICGKMDIEVQPGEGDQSGHQKRRQPPLAFLKQQHRCRSKGNRRMSGGERIVLWSGNEQLNSRVQHKGAGPCHQRLENDIAGQHLYDNGKKHDTAQLFRFRDQYQDTAQKHPADPLIRKSCDDWEKHIAKAGAQGCLYPVQNGQFKGNHFCSSHIQR